MRAGMRLMLTLSIAAALVCVSYGQQQKKRGGGGGGGFGQGFGGFGGGGLGMGAMLNNEGVQKELKLSEEQITKVREATKEVGAKYREEFGKLQDLSQEERREKMTELRTKQEADTKKALEGVLNADQEKRLKQITLQQRGVQAFTDAEVATALKLSDEQKDTLKTINDDSAKDLRELFAAQRGGGGGGFNQEAFQENMKKMQAMRKEAMDKAVAVLKDDQKKAWKDMTGEPFTMTMQGFGGRGGDKGGFKKKKKDG